MEAKIYNQSGKSTGSITLPESVFGVAWNSDMVHQVVTTMQANARTPVAHTHDRSEQRGGGKKPWKQKGTGNARHGSRRSPIWRGGGVTFGPRNDKKYGGSIPHAMKVKALYSVLSKKFADNEIIFVDSLSFAEPKTKDAKGVLQDLAKVTGNGLVEKKTNSAYIALTEADKNVAKSFSNMGNITVDEVRNINPVALLKSKYLIVLNPKDAIAFLSSKNKKQAK
ncbi:MAG: 50S ribosomal protein L4 [Candidatus Paceibacterota bacterium]